MCRWDQRLTRERSHGAAVKLQGGAGGHHPPHSVWDVRPPTCLQLSSCEDETKTEALAGGREDGGRPPPTPPPPPAPGPARTQAGPRCWRPSCRAALTGCGSRRRHPRSRRGPSWPGTADRESRAPRLGPPDRGAVRSPPQSEAAHALQCPPAGHSPPPHVCLFYETRARGHTIGPKSQASLPGPEPTGPPGPPDGKDGGQGPPSQPRVQATEGSRAATGPQARSHAGKPSLHAVTR